MRQLSVFKTRAGALGLLLFSFSRHSFAGECDAILQSGIRNTFLELRTGDFAQTFKSAYCQKQSSSSGSSFGTEAGGSYAGYGLNYGQNNSDTAESRQENCGDNASSMSYSNYIKALQSVADQRIVAAWQQCTTKAYGLYINGDIDGEVIPLTVKFLPAGAISQTTIRYNPTIHGADCGDILQRGMVINTGGVTVACKRQVGSEVLVVLNSDFGPATFYIPPLRPTSPAPPAPTPNDNKDIVVTGLRPVRVGRNGMLWLQKDENGTPIYLETDIEVTLKKNRSAAASGCQGQMLYPDGNPGYSVNGSDTIPAGVKEIVLRYRFKFRPNEYVVSSNFRFVCLNFPIMVTDWHHIKLPDTNSTRE